MFVCIYRFVRGENLINFMFMFGVSISPTYILSRLYCAMSHPTSEWPSYAISQNVEYYVLRDSLFFSNNTTKGTRLWLRLYY